MAERSKAMEQQAVRDGSAVYVVEPDIATAEDVPLGYKRTEVGVIPKDWIVEKIGNLKPFVTSGSRGWARFYSDTGATFLRITNLTRQSIHLDLSELKFVELPFEGFAEANRTGVKDGDLLISITADIGVIGYVKTSVPKPAFLNQHLALVRFDPEAVSSKYSAYYLASERPQRLFLASMDVGAKAGMNLTTIRKLQLVLPPLREQRAIATALSDADALIESLDRLIAKKRAIKQAAMQQLLTGQTRLPGFTGEWETKRLGEVSNIKTGDRNNQDKIKDGRYPFFVRSEFVERINSYSYDCEAIVVPGEGRIGDIFHYVNGRFDVHQRVYAITQFDPCTSPKFVYYYMANFFGDWAMRNTVKATVDSLRLPTFQNFEMFLPPSEGEQTSIATVLSDMDTEIEALDRRREKARQIKQGIMQQLLTGRVRLVTPEVAA